VLDIRNPEASVIDDFQGITRWSIRLICMETLACESYQVEDYSLPRLANA